MYTIHLYLPFLSSYPASFALLLPPSSVVLSGTVPDSIHINSALPGRCPVNSSCCTTLTATTDPRTVKQVEHMNPSSSEELLTLIVDQSQGRAHIDKKLRRATQRPGISYKSGQTPYSEAYRIH